MKKQSIMFSTCENITIFIKIKEDVACELANWKVYQAIDILQQFILSSLVLLH